MLFGGFITVTGLLGWVVYKIEKITNELENKQ